VILLFLNLSLQLNVVLAFQKPSIQLLVSPLTTTVSNDVQTSSDNRKRLPQHDPIAFGTITTTMFYTKSPITTTSSIGAASKSTGSSTTPLAYKFKNIDEMIDTFRDESILLYFTSGTCGPCHLQKKELVTVQSIVGKDAALKVLTIDTKKWPHTGTQFAIGKLPCLLVMKNKQIINRFDGLTHADELVQKVYSNKKQH
jgi:Thioredoxin